MQRTSIHGVGGAAVHAHIPAKASQVSLALHLGFSFSKGEKGWRWWSALALREKLRLLPEHSDRYFETDADAAFAALSALGSTLSWICPREAMPEARA